MEVTDSGSVVWTWRLAGPSSGVETSPHSYPNYGAAVMDAIKHGFQPSADHWTVITSAGITRFEPSGTTAEDRALEHAHARELRHRG
jgi:hypothetical protein